jgi:hypothetical protein
MYQLHFRHENVAAINNMGISFRFNVQDGSNCAVASIYWLSGTSVWQLDYGELVASVWTNKGVSGSVGISVPIQGVLTVFDDGDNVIIHVTLYNPNSTTVRSFMVGGWTTVGRLFKTATGVQVYTQDTPGTNMRFRSLLVMDM